MKKLETTRIDGGTETITVEQKLSVEELEKCSGKLADIVLQIAEVEVEKKESAKFYSDKIKSLQVISEVHANEVKTAIRKVQLNAKVRNNTNENVWEFVDEETGEVVKREPYLLPPAPLFDEQKDETEAVEVDEEELETA